MSTMRRKANFSTLADEGAERQRNGKKENAARHMSVALFLTKCATRHDLDDIVFHLMCLSMQSTNSTCLKSPSHWKR
eukprot:5669543-Ditylum_brightwellii.AAC.1